MKELIIEGKKELKGSIKIGGAKNSIVALIPATALTNEKCVIENVPDISDVRELIEIMKYLGSKIEFKDETLIIDNSNLKNKLIPEEYSRKLRASYYFMGSLIGRFHEANISFPGGCIIGSRPIDYHLAAFKRLGIKINEKENIFHMSTKELKGNVVYFDVPSVGATINVMLASSISKNITKIINAAREPEIENVAELLNNMGAKITGAGTSTIIIEGVDSLHGANVKVIPDRIEAGTYLIIGALIGNNLEIKNINASHLDALLFKLSECGVKFKIKKDSIIINKAKKLKAVNIRTDVYPGFPTDLGQPMSTFLTQCEGESLFNESIYENRLRHVPHLNNMGADIHAFDTKAIIKGKTNLYGKNVKATDLRAGASMLVAGMIADGTTRISNIEHLLRGYEKIVDKLNGVGANIKLIDE